MRQIYVAICIGFIIIIGNTLGELGRSNFDSTGQIFKNRISPLYFLDTSSSFYHIYSIKGDFPNLAIRKVGHFFFYGFIAILLFRVGKRKSLLLNGILSVLLTICVGILDEVYQYFLIGRSGRLLDILIDAAGCFTFLLFYLLSRLLVRHRDRSAVPLESKGGT
ncbi:VanZ family protein [Robertmurraya korlensis]|uniref:VanZ family protein n=1 Tax=Robertmurraya korlensis TaxID=519977 RepID=UPI0008249835|nr:VanZ family protein [Robertmurraya korlensis]